MHHDVSMRNIDYKQEFFVKMCIENWSFDAEKPQMYIQVRHMQQPFGKDRYTISVPSLSVLCLPKFPCILNIE